MPGCRITLTFRHQQARTWWNLADRRNAHLAQVDKAMQANDGPMNYPKLKGNHYVQ
jgi:hypothetical protein